MGYNPIFGDEWDIKGREQEGVLRSLILANKSHEETNRESEDTQPGFAQTNLFTITLVWSQEPMTAIRMTPVDAQGPPQTATVLKDLRSLSSDEDGPPPTPFALFTARTNLESSYNSIFVRRGAHQARSRLLNIPVPTMVTDEIGSIMIAWRTPTRLVVANFAASPDRKSFIYSSHQGQQATSDPMNEVNLRARLQRLAE